MTSESERSGRDHKNASNAESDPEGARRQSHGWDPTGYIRHAGFVPAYGEDVVDLLAPAAGQTILDLGCGEGSLTRKIIEHGATVIAVDASPEMVARARAEGIDARRGDGQTLDFDASFDAVFSNAAMHWMPNHDAVVAGVARGLRPGGRFVGEFGGHGNVAAICVALFAALARHGTDASARMPWTFPTDEEFGATLSAHGFRIDVLTLIPRRTPLPTGMAGWLETFAGPFFAGLSAATTRAVLDDTLDLIAPVLRDRNGNWYADYVRLRFAAHKPD